ncbi:hypothetical protein VE25_09805, partial [Devosia geojensis]
RGTLAAVGCDGGAVAEGPSCVRMSIRRGTGRAWSGTCEAGAVRLSWRVPWAHSVATGGLGSWGAGGGGMWEVGRVSKTGVWEVDGGSGRHQREGGMEGGRGAGVAPRGEEPGAEWRGLGYRRATVAGVVGGDDDSRAGNDGGARAVEQTDEHVCAVVG